MHDKRWRTLIGRAAKPRLLREARAGTSSCSATPPAAHQHLQPPTTNTTTPPLRRHYHLRPDTLRRRPPLHLTNASLILRPCSTSSFLAPPAVALSLPVFRAFPPFAHQPPAQPCCSSAYGKDEATRLPLVWICIGSTWRCDNMLTKLLRRGEGPHCHWWRCCRIRCRHQGWPGGSQGTLGICPPRTLRKVTYPNTSGYRLPASRSVAPSVVLA